MNLGGGAGKGTVQPIIIASFTVALPRTPKAAFRGLQRLTKVPELSTVIPGPRHVGEANTTQSTRTDSGRGQGFQEMGVPLEKARTYARHPEPMDVYRTGERDQERARDLGPGQEPRLSKQAA